VDRPIGVHVEQLDVSMIMKWRCWQALRARWLLPLTLVLSMGSGAAMAEPSSQRVKLIEVRPYIGNSDVYIRTNVDAVCGTPIFRIVTSQPNGKEAYAAALTAITSGRSVVLEVSNATGCTGWGTALQSIYIVAD